MKRALPFLVAAFIAALPLAVSAGPYDKAAVQTNMRANGARLQAIKAAIGGMDYSAASAAFVDFGKEAVALQKMDPPKGSKDDWVKTWKSFEDAAARGVAACVAKDAAAAQKALEEIQAIMKYGHPTFR